MSSELGRKLKQSWPIIMCMYHVITDNRKLQSMMFGWPPVALMFIPSFAKTRQVVLKLKNDMHALHGGLMAYFFWKIGHL
jgi:hypothetical protein